MKTVIVSKRSKSVTALLKQARRQNLIIRSPEGREFVLAEVDDFNREIELARQNKDLMQLLEQRAKQTKTVSLDDAKSQLGID